MNNTKEIKMPGRFVAELIYSNKRRGNYNGCFYIDTEEMQNNYILTNVKNFLIKDLLELNILDGYMKIEIKIYKERDFLFYKSYYAHFGCENVKRNAFFRFYKPSTYKRSTVTLEEDIDKLPT